MGYLPRAVDQTLRMDLESMGGVLLEGVRGCGKTESGMQQSHSHFRVDQAQNRRLAELNPASALAGNTPRLIDEWQLAPDLWNEIRHEIDFRKNAGQFIISGSATPCDDITRHTGAGRISRIKMRPMALAESHPAPDLVTLSHLREHSAIPPIAGRLSYDELAIEAVRGGWPALVATQQRGFVRFVRNYLDNIVHTDLLQLGTVFSTERIERLLRSISRNIASETTATTLAQDVSADGGTLSAASVRTYLDALTQIFVVEELPAWSGSLRSKSRLRKQSKLHFCDPSLACASLRATPERLANEPEYFGQIFESMAVRDIRTYAEQIDASCFGYRDESGLEVDIVIEFAEGGWAGIEVKLGESDRIIQAAEHNLLRLKNDRLVREPDFLAVVTGGMTAFTLPSGVHVIPLSAMGMMN
ncbi:ATP-binding protein [Arcanobacterium haemolyticum]|nr:ATP-binding protein [Arcanobacterium haemolyticum]